MPRSMAHAGAVQGDMRGKGGVRMDIAIDQVPFWLSLSSLAVWAWVFRRAWRGAGAEHASGRRAAPSPHLLGALAAAVALLWAFKVTPMPGFSVHLLGAAAATLMLGPSLALIAVSAGAVGAALLGAVPVAALPLAALVQGVLPVLVARWWLAGTERLLGAHPFVYLLGVAFFGTSVAVLAEGLVGLSLSAALGAPAPDIAWVALLPLAYAEAFITGALTTVFVVYRPQWVATFDDARYLRRS